MLALSKGWYEVVLALSSVGTTQCMVPSSVGTAVHAQHIHHDMSGYNILVITCSRERGRLGSPVSVDHVGHSTRFLVEGEFCSDVARSCSDVARSCSDVVRSCSDRLAPLLDGWRGGGGDGRPSTPCVLCYN